jgi:LuxR family quorum sensing-dependent transcriptional regulator
LALLEIIQGCVHCESEDGLRWVYSQLRGLLTFDLACAVLGRRDERRGVMVEHIVNISCPDEFVQECRTGDYFQRSALCREHFRTYSLKFWSEARRKLGQPKDLVSLALDFGMRDGFTVGSRPLAAAAHGSMFCLSVPSVRRDERTEMILQFVVPHLHLALCRLFDGQQRDAGSVALSTREKDILRLIMQGKSSWDMSVIMGISERTVNYHIYKVMERLDVINRPQAVAAAVRLGLIGLD